MLPSAGNQIESEFDRLKTRRRILAKHIYLSFDAVPLTIYKCFLLHNFCQTNVACALDEEEEKAGKHGRGKYDETTRSNTFFKDT